MTTMRDKTTVEQEQMALHSYPPDKGGKGGLLHFSRIHSYPSDKGTKGSPFFR